MLNSAESVLYRAIGRFSTVVQVVKPGQQLSDNYAGSFNLIPGQCAAFLASNQEFLWFIEQYDVENDLLATLSNKKVYPAKVTGINLAFLASQTFKWRDGLIQSSVLSGSSRFPDTAFRPGFGQVIASDLSRPVKSVSVQRNDLNLGTIAVLGSSICGPLGRLMSIASYVDPELAAKYDGSNSKKRKKSLNEQDYQQMPQYPAYTPYQNNNGY
jgi:hypothetical protein